MRTERRRRGWSQRQAAEHGGVDNGLWSRMEKGSVAISDRSRAAVAKAFEWPLDWDVAEPWPPPANDSVNQYDALEVRVRDLEALVRALTRALLGDR